MYSYVFVLCITYSYATKLHLETFLLHNFIIPMWNIHNLHIKHLKKTFIITRQNITEHQFECLFSWLTQSWLIATQNQSMQKKRQNSTDLAFATAFPRPRPTTLRKMIEAQEIRSDWYWARSESGLLPTNQIQTNCWWNLEFGSKPAKGKGGSKVKTLSKAKRRRLDLQLHQTGPWSGKSFISVASYLLVWVWTDLRCSQQSVPMHCWVQEKQSDWCQLGDLGSQEKMVKH